MPSKTIKKYYELFIIVLALLSIILVILDLGSVISLSLQPFRTIDLLILIVFTLDYIFRFFLSPRKFEFFKSNFFDLLAIIPFNSIFTFFRFARLFRITKVVRLSKLSKATRLVRTLGFLGILKERINKFLRTNGFIYVLYCSMVLILISSVLMSFVEGRTFWEALWWSIVTCTTVGYGDISPVTGVGRFMAIILMLFGIGFIGMLTGTITTYFTNKAKSSKADVSELITVAEKLEEDDLLKLIEEAKSMLEV